MRKRWAVETDKGELLQDTYDSCQEEAWYSASRERLANPILRGMKKAGVSMCRVGSESRAYAKRAGWKVVEAKVVKV